MNLHAVRLFAQPAFQAVFAATLVGLAATLMGRSAESKTAKIPVDRSRPRPPQDR